MLPFLLLALPLLSLSYLPQVTSHSRPLCLDTVIENNRIVGCRGYPNYDRPYSFFTQNDMPAVKAGTYNIEVGRRPPMDQITKVTRGQKINVLNTINNHHEDFEAYYQEPNAGRAVNFNTPLTKFDSWFQDKNLMGQPVLLYSGKCNPVKQGDKTQLGQMIIQHMHDLGGVDMSEDVVCWRELTIPNNWANGLHRVMYYGNRKADNNAAMRDPNMWFYIEVLWFNVVSSLQGANTNSLTGSMPNSVGRKPYRPDKGQTYTQVPLHFQYSTKSQRSHIQVTISDGSGRKVGEGRGDVPPGSGSADIDAFADFGGGAIQVKAQLIDDADRGKVLAQLGK